MANKRHEKRQAKPKWQRRAKKILKLEQNEQEKLKINTPPESDSP
jgi:hypothetical protein